VERSSNSRIKPWRLFRRELPSVTGLRSLTIAWNSMAGVRSVIGRRKPVGEKVKG